MIYRLYTEDKNRKEIEKIVSKYFDGFTVFTAKGYWEGKSENSLVIEILIEQHFFGEHLIIYEICKEIKALNDQESVLVVKLNCDSEFI